MPETLEGPYIQIRLFGQVQLNEGKQAPVHFRSNSERALLTYLAMEAGRPLNREVIHGLIWPNLGETQARNNLRVTLSRLKNLVADGDELFRTSGNVIELNPQAGIRIDVLDFLALAEESRMHPHPPGQDCTACMERNRQAVGLVRGEFAEGLVLNHNNPYMEWLALTRERLHREVLVLLFVLADYHARRGELRRAEGYARRQLELEPWREEAHRQLMTILARGDQKSAALAQYSKLEQVLADELGVEPSAETLALYERIQSARRRPASNLPGTTEPFIGRQAELAQIIDFLADPACRVLTITGPGGIGKTRLALQAADKQQHAYLDGIAYIPLTSVTSTEFLARAMVNALEIAPRGRTGLENWLLDYLRGKEKLIVLDNFEHLIDGAGLLVKVLAEAPGIRLMITSRQRLNLSAERLYEIRGMRCPELGDLPGAEAYDAVQLFTQTARRAAADFSLAKEIRGVVRICQLLEGMPLGIELAAARVREYTSGEIADRLQQGIDFLATSRQDVSPRHRSLRAAFEQSWALLTSAEQEVFSKLSIFRSGFDGEAAAHVAGASRNVLSSFLDKSLLRRMRVADSRAAIRFDLHELLRQFAGEKLVDLSGGDSVTGKERLAERHGRYYAAFVREREPYMRGERTHLALFEIRDEIENVRAAWRWATEHGTSEDVHAFLFVMLHFYEIQGWFTEAEQFFSESVRRLDQLAQAESGPDSTAFSSLGLALFLQGWYTMRLSQYDLAESQYNRALAIAHQLDNLELESYCLDGLGVMAKFTGEFSQAIEYLEKCYRICKDIDLRWMAGGALANLGDIATMQGRYDNAVAYLEESLTLHTRMEDKWGIATRAFLLGDLAVRMGQYDRAESLIKESLLIHEEIGQRWRTADPIYLLGKLAARRGNFTQAQAYYQESLQLVQDTGDRDRVALVLAQLGDTNLALGKPKEAERNFLKSLGTAVEIRAEPVILRNLLGLATLHAKGGDWETAVELLSSVIVHPAVEQSVKERARLLLDELKEELDRETISEAFERGKRKGIETLLEKILRQPLASRQHFSNQA